MRINRKLIILLFFIGIAFSSFAWDSKDNPIWLSGSVSTKVASNLTLRAQQQIRFRDNGEGYYYRRTGIAFIYRLSPKWIVAPTYRYLETREYKEKWAKEHIYLLSLTTGRRYKRVDLRPRLRLVYQNNEEIGDTTDVRFKLTVLPSRGYLKWNFRPYIADELLFAVDKELDFYRNRVSTGLRFKPLRALLLDLFIMHERSNSSDDNWGERYNMRMYASYSF